MIATALVDQRSPAPSGEPLGQGCLPDLAGGVAAHQLLVGSLAPGLVHRVGGHKLPPSEELDLEQLAAYQQAHALLGKEPAIR